MADHEGNSTSNSNNLPSEPLNPASNSNTDPPSPSEAEPFDYEVFLSFRGEDTRTGFTDHLYNALVNAGIRTFRDNERLFVGEELSLVLPDAIEQSKISIPIFSRDYASSHWCLIEFAQIMKCKRDKGQWVFPIFYEVFPSKTHEAKLVKMVVSRVCEKLNKNEAKVTDVLVGMDNHITEMMNLISVCLDDVRMIGIHGVRGIGKTTIAKVIYNQLCKDFDGWSFLADVRATAAMDIVHLQNQLLTDVLHKNLDIKTVDRGVDLIKNTFRKMKVLIVLDDVDSQSQLNALAREHDWFGKGSRIIVTSRYSNIFTGKKQWPLYKPPKMDSVQSTQLFSKHAFGCDQPAEEYFDLSRDIVSTVGGLPWSLERLGKVLCGKSRAVWKDTKKRLTKIPASNSSTDRPSSSEAEAFDYEVFLSFQGEDTRTGFTDHLYNALLDAGIRTFRDNDRISVGEELSLVLLEEIEQLKISIPIFSKRYASSKRCLIELALMMKCKREKGQWVFPIFYDVSPSVVRHQGKPFYEDFLQHDEEAEEHGRESERKKKIVQEWREDLKEVATLKGWEVAKIANGHQAELVKLVVSRVCETLNKNEVKVTDVLVGMDIHVKEMMNLISVCSDDVRMIGIHGMGGIGKTTIAKVIYKQLCKDFDGWSFLADVRATAVTDIVHLQNQLLTDILRKHQDIETVDRGVDVIKITFRKKKVLVVLDDVDSQSQLNALAIDHDWFKKGSRIIVTSRNSNIFTGKEHWQLYKPLEMDSVESMQLFSTHAFAWDQPAEEDYDLSRDIVSTVGGLPLSLEILGKFLCGKNRAVWKDTQKRLTKIPDDRVQEKLKISYDGLDYETKQIFLDIACLFIGLDKRIVFCLWEDSDFFPENGIEVLHSLSLVKIGDDNLLRMHDQVRDLGREIVRQENPMDLGKRSRLWLHKEALEVLEGRLGTKKVDSLCLRFQSPSKEHRFTSTEFQKLINLRYLQIDHVHLDGDFNNLLFRLRWLRWNFCPPTFSVTNFHLKNLVILDLSYSKIPNYWIGWRHIKMARKLKVLSLKGCDEITRTPDFSTFVELERLILEGCHKLLQIDASVGDLKNLVYWNMKGCSGLRELPQLGPMDALREIILDGCTKIKGIPMHCMDKLQTLGSLNCSSLTQISSIGYLKSLLEVNFSGSSIEELPDSVGSLAQLQRLSLHNCKKLRTVSKSIGKLECLLELHLSGTDMLKELPEAIGGLTNLRVLDISSSGIRRFPSDIKNLVNLKELKGPYCRELSGEIPSDIGKLSSLATLSLNDTRICGLPESISKLSSLQTLDFAGCEIKIPEDFQLELPSSLRNLSVSYTRISTNSEANERSGRLSIPRDFFFFTVNKLPKLENLILDSLKFFSLPMELSSLSELKELTIWNCEELQCLSNLPPNLLQLGVYKCKSLKSLPDDLSNLKNLTKVVLYSCRELAEIPRFKKRESYISLEVYDCSKLPKSETMEHLHFHNYGEDNFPEQTHRERIFSRRT